MRTITIPYTVYDDDEQAVRGLWFTPDGKQLIAATGSASNTYRLNWWDLGRDEHTRETIFHPPDEMEDAMTWPDPAVAPAAGLFAVPDWDEDEEVEFLRVYRFRDPDRPVARTVPRPWWSVDEIAFTPSGRHLLARTPAGASGWSAVVRWPIPDDLPEVPPADPVRLRPSPVWSLKTAEAAVGWGYGLSADGRRVAAGTSDGNVAVWSFPTARRVAALRPPKGRGKQVVTGPVALNRDGTTVAGCHEHAAYLWDVPNPAPRAVVKGAGTGVEFLRFSPDGRRLVAVPREGPVRVIDPTAGKVVGLFDWKIGDQYSLAFGPDGLTVAVGGDKGRIVIWDLDG